MDMINEAIRESCVLVGIKFSAYRGQRTDKSAGDEVTQSKGAIHGAAKVTVKVLAGTDKLQQAILKKQRETRDMLHDRSMFYDGLDGYRLLPNANFFEFIRDFTRLKKEHDGLVDQLRQEAPGIIAQAQINLGDLDVDIPTVDELTESFGMELTTMDVPEWNKARPRAGLPASAVEKLSIMQEAKIRNAAEVAVRDVFERVLKPAEDFAAAMTRFNDRELAKSRGEDVGKKGYFKDSVVTNLTSIVSALESFNVTNDPRLTQLSKDVAALAKADPDKLRDNIAVREDAVSQAQSVIASLQGWLNPGADNGQAAA